MVSVVFAVTVAFERQKARKCGENYSDPSAISTEVSNGNSLEACSFALESNSIDRLSSLEVCDCHQMLGA